jgi:hypothetical protein
MGGDSFAIIQYLFALAAEQAGGATALAEHPHWRC